MVEKPAHWQVMKMGRLDDLRNKFRQKADENIKQANSDEFIFRDALESFVAARFNASSDDEVFYRKVYNMYNNDRPKSIESWLESVLKDKFTSLTNPPRWMDEPDWSYQDGVPLNFINQFAGPDGIEFYVFEGIAEDTSRPFYKMVAQSAEGKVHLEGLISTPA